MGETGRELKGLPKGVKLGVRLRRGETPLSFKDVVLTLSRFFARAIVLLCNLMERDWSFSRPSSHCATGNRCLADHALILARTSVLDSSAATTACLN